MRDAIEMVVRLTENGERRRDEIAKIVFRITDQIALDASALANLTLSEMDETARMTG